MTKLWLPLGLFLFQCSLILWSCAHPYPFQEPPHIEDILTEDDEDEYFQSGEEELLAIRNLVSTRLGITNFSRPALLEVAIQGAFDYLKSVAVTEPPNGTTSRNGSQTASFDISLSDLMTLTNGTNLYSNGGVIELALPVELRQNLEAIGIEVTIPPINKNEMMKNIESALMGAIMEAHQVNPVQSSKAQQVNPVQSTKAPAKSKPNVPVRTRPTTTSSPVDRFFMQSWDTFIQEGQKEVSQFFWKNLLRIGGENAQSFVDDVIICTVLSNCNDLGQNRRRP